MGAMISRTRFPDVRNIAPVRDPKVISELDESLVEALRERSNDPLLSVPELLDFNDGFSARFSGTGKSLLYPDVYLDLYYRHLDNNSFPLATLDRDQLQRQKLELVGEDEIRKAGYPIYKCLVFDSKIASDSAIYHLMEGSWYRFESDYVKRLTDSLAYLLHSTALPDCADHEEKDYNSSATTSLLNGVCLDRKNFSPRGQSQMEPCDVLFEESGTAVFAHVKMSTASSELSHLFNQGTNSMELLRSNDDAAALLRTVITKEASKPDIANRIIELLDSEATRTDFIVVTHKPASGGIENLPLFSRISLSRAARSFKAMGVPLRLSYVSDVSPDRDGTAKKRRHGARKADASASAP